MAVIAITTKMSAGVEYTHTTADSTDWASVSNDIYFFDLTEKLVYYKDVNGSIQDIYKQAPSVQTIVSTTTVTATSEQDLIEVTALEVGMELSNPTGVFTNGQLLEYKIKDSGTPRTLTLGSNIRNFTTFGLVTTASKWTRLIVEYNATDTKWDIIGFNTQP